MGFAASVTVNWHYYESQDTEILKDRPWLGLAIIMWIIINNNFLAPITYRHLQ